MLSDTSKTIAKLSSQQDGTASWQGFLATLKASAVIMQVQRTILAPPQFSMFPVADDDDFYTWYALDCAAVSAFSKLTLRLEDRRIAASTSILLKTGKPYALRFHRSMSSTAACSMRRAVQCSARHCRADAQRERPELWPALHAMPTCTSVFVSPPSHRQHTMPTGPRMQGCRLRLSFLLLDQAHARQTDLHGHVATAGGRPHIASHARLCWWAWYRGRTAC